MPRISKGILVFLIARFALILIKDVVVCSGFISDGSMLNTFGIEFGLIVCTDTYSHHLNKSDRSTQSLFSDGATSVIISKSKKWMLVDSALCD